MIIPVFILFGIIACLFLFEKEDATPDPLVMASIFISMVVICAFRDINMPDANIYIDDFQRVDLIDRFEIGYAAIRSIIHLFTRDYVVLFFSVALLSLLIKFRAMYDLAPFFYGSLLVYMSNYFILHDMIQIRAGVASSLFIFGIKYITERNIKMFLYITIFATCFHYSGLLLFPLWFISYKTPSRAVWLCIIPASYVLALCGLTLSSYIEFIPYAPIQHLWEQYKLTLSDGISEYVNIFNLVLLAKMAIVTYLIYYLDLLKDRYNHFDIWLWIYTLGLVSFVIFSDVPVLAFRISELLAIVEIILIPFVIYTLRYMIVSKALVIIIALSLLLINIYYSELLL